MDNISISGLVVEYIVAIDVTRAGFPADAYFSGCLPLLRCKWGWGPPLGFIHASGQPIARQLHSAHGAIRKPRGQATGNHAVMLQPGFATKSPGNATLSNPGGFHHDAFNEPALPTGLSPGPMVTLSSGFA